MMSDKRTEEEQIGLRDRLTRSIQNEYAKRNILLRIHNIKLKTVSLKCDRDGFNFSKDSQSNDENPIPCEFRIDLMHDGEKWTHQIVCGDHNHDISDRRAIPKRCGGCGNPGHNSRSCKTKQDPNSLLLAIKFGLPKSTAIIRPSKPPTIILPTGKGRFLGFVRMQSKCKNCGQSGHNSRSCDTNYLTPITPIYMPTQADLNQRIYQRTFHEAQLHITSPSEKFDSLPLQNSSSADHLSRSTSAEPIVKISQLLNNEDSSQAENPFSFKISEHDNNINVATGDIPLWSKSIKIMKKQKLMHQHISTRQRCGVCGLPGHNSRKHSEIPPHLRLQSLYSSG